MVGLVFFFGCVVGLIRFPDFYTRMHAAGKGDTLSTALILIGFALLSPPRGGDRRHTCWWPPRSSGSPLFIMLTSPASTHALMRAGYEDGIVPYEGPETEGQQGGRMIWPFDIVILVLLVVTAVISLRVKDLLAASVVFGIYSFLICLLWAEMEAVDVAFTEATVGAGVSTVFLVATVFNTRRNSSD